MKIICIEPPICMVYIMMKTKNLSGLLIAPTERAGYKAENNTWVL